MSAWMGLIGWRCILMLEALDEAWARCAFSRAHSSAGYQLLSPSTGQGQKRTPIAKMARVVKVYLNPTSCTGDEL